VAPATSSLRVEPPIHHPIPVARDPNNALVDPYWRRTMEEEYEALLSNRTWDLVPRPQGANVVTGKWIFRHKLKAVSSFDRYKACWVLWGFTQRHIVDFDKIFSPVMKPATVHTVLTLALSQWWLVHQLNVKNAFLHDTLSEIIAPSPQASSTPPTLSWCAGSTSPSTV
jgi:hypothetical protein